jgi:hypothetical protein
MVSELQNSVLVGDTGEIIINMTLEENRMGCKMWDILVLKVEGSGVECESRGIGIFHRPDFKKVGGSSVWCKADVERSRIGSENRYKWVYICDLVCCCVRLDIHT